MPYAANTSVAPEKSRAEIEATLKRYGATTFSYGWDGDRAIVAFRANDRMVKMQLRVPALDEFRYAGNRRRTQAQQASAHQQGARQRWRALLLVIKAKLEAVESGIETFEEAFMPHILLPDGSTVGEFITPQVERAYETGEMLDLLPASRLQLESGA